MTSASTIIGRFVTLIINPAILIIFSGGFFMFMYGLVEFMWGINQGKHEDEGKQHMLWGVVGMLIMVSVFGIITLLSDTFGLGIQPNGTYNPDTSALNNIPAPANFFQSGGM